MIELRPASFRPNGVIEIDISWVDPGAGERVSLVVDHR